MRVWETNRSKGWPFKCIFLSTTSISWYFIRQVHTTRRHWYSLIKKFCITQPPWGMNKYLKLCVLWIPVCIRVIMTSIVSPCVVHRHRYLPFPQIFRKSLCYLRLFHITNETREESSINNNNKMLQATIFDAWQNKC